MHYLEHYMIYKAFTFRQFKLEANSALRLQLHHSNNNNQQVRTDRQRVNNKVQNTMRNKYMTKISKIQ